MHGGTLMIPTPHVVPIALVTDVPIATAWRSKMPPMSSWSLHMVGSTMLQLDVDYASQMICNEDELSHMEIQAEVKAFFSTDST